MNGKKTVKISDVNKEISYEMKTDESINSLLNITQLLDGRIDVLKDDLEDMKNVVNKIKGRMGI